MTHRSSHHVRKLVFLAEGGVELHSADGTVEWSSDDDDDFQDDFAEEGSDDAPFLDSDDAEEVLEWLHENTGHVDDDEDFDIFEKSAEGELIPKE